MVDSSKIAPLPETFMIAAIVGFLITAFLIAPKNTTWGFTLLIVFAVMFIASFISMTKGPVVEEMHRRKR